MLGRLDRKRNFFDESLFGHMPPAEHPLLDIDRAVDFWFVFLAVWANLSDVQVCQQLRYNVLYRYFCRIGWEDAIPDDTTLVRSRQRLGEERWQRLLQRLVEQARAKGCLKGRWLVMDSSPVVAHAAARSRQRQRLPKQGFTYDKRRRQWICPEGHGSIGQSPHQRGGWLVYFPERACRGCPRAGRCLSRSQTRKVLYWHLGTEANRPRGLKRASRVRTVIERTFGEAKQWHGLGRSRYRGWERTAIQVLAIQVLMTCLVFNAKKMARRFQDVPGRGKGPRAMERAAA